MTLVLRGDKERLKELANRARKYGLDVILFDEERLEIRKIELAVPCNSEYPPELWSLPDHLRKTALTLYKLGEATAEEIAEITGRVRAVESDHLNQIYRKGLCEKERRGRKVFYIVKKE